MIIHNITYNGVDLSDLSAKNNYVVIQENAKQLNLRTKVFDNLNAFWSRTTNTVAWGRLFSFTGQVFWDRANAQIWQDTLNNLLIPDSEFYELTWTDDWGTEYKTKAKVYQMPIYSPTLDNDIVDFTFQLYSEDAEFNWIVDFTATGAIWNLWWVELGVVLWTELWEALGEIEIINEWNWNAKTRVNIIWQITNPKVLNLNNWEFYKLNTTTGNLIIDNRETPIIVEDNLVNVKEYREAWSVWLTLEPWLNRVIVIWTPFDVDNPTSITVTIEYNNTYINS